MAGIPGQPSPSPSDVASPVPGQSAASVFDAAEPAQARAAGKAASVFDGAGGGSAFDAPAIPAEQPGIAHQALDVATRALDYPGGLVRTTAAAAMGAAGVEDFKKAAVGQAPNSAEYLKRLGVSEGGSLSLPGLGRVTLRGAEGLALDIASDPLTLIAKTAKALPAVQRLLGVPGHASEALGEAIYKSAITAKDESKAAKAGATLIEQGAPVGGTTALEQKISDAASAMGKIRQGLYDKFTQLGGKIDGSAEGLYKNAEGVIAKLRENPTLATLADEFETMLNQYKGEGYIPVDKMSQWKTQLYDSLPKSAFNGARLGSPGKMFKAALAHDFKNAIVASGDAVEDGLGKAINEVNDKWGALLEADPVKNPLSGTLGKAIDGATFAVAGIPGLIKKKALEVAVGPYGRTITGKALMAAGQTDVINRLFRQSLHDSQDSGQ